jgi:hypothetical protein
VEGGPHQGMKSAWETPPGFQHQNVREGLKRRTETSTEWNHALLARQKGVWQSQGVRVQASRVGRLGFSKPKQEQRQDAMFLGNLGGLLVWEVPRLFVQAGLWFYHVLACRGDCSRGSGGRGSCTECIHLEFRIVRQLILESWTIVLQLITDWRKVIH